MIGIADKKLDIVLEKPFKHRLFEILERGSGDDWRSRLVDTILIILILINVIAVILETVDEIYARWQGLFYWIEIVSLTIFSVEYVMRVWVSDQNPLYRSDGSFIARIRYIRSPGAIIDLLAIAPAYLTIFFPGLDLRLLRLFRLVRFLKLARYSPGISSLLEAIRSEQRALLAAVVIMLGIALVGASGLYILERHVQPEKFGSIPAALWWAIATLTTVGYGDVVPVTAAGKILGGVLMMFGLGMFALPIGIIATAFSQEIHKRDFVVRWGMVAKVPLFAKLSADEISEIVKLLEAQTYKAGQSVVRKGEPATSMFFVVSGSVEVEIADKPIILEAGGYFGEIAILKKTLRVATVRTLETTQLLSLGAEDVHRLMQQKPSIAEDIQQMAKSRLAAHAENGTQNPADDE